MLMLDLKHQPEEVANTLTHGLGAIAGAIGGIIIIALAARSADVWQVTGAVVYSLALVLLYAASTLFHWEQDSRIKRRLEILDHCAIYVLIAGTYTPFLLVTLRDSSIGPVLLAVIWTLAVAGIIFKLIFKTRFRLTSTLLYIAMGWLIVVAAGPLINALPLSVLFFLLFGGIAYTVGTYFFCNERLPYTHAIWHIFVLVGSVFHFVAVATQVVPS